MCFFAAKLKSTILCALLDHLSEQNWGFLMNFSQKMFPKTPPGNGNVGLGPRDLPGFGFKVGKNSPRRKNRRRNFGTKKTFLGLEFFLLFKLKLQYFVQESAAKCTIFIFCKKKFFENFVFLTETVSDLAMRYTLCGRYTLCAHCTIPVANQFFPCNFVF